LNVHGCLVKSFQNEKWILWFSSSFEGSMYECNVNPLHICINNSCRKNLPSWSILHLQSPYYALWNIVHYNVSAYNYHYLQTHITSDINHINGASFPNQNMIHWQVKIQTQNMKWKTKHKSIQRKNQHVL
jgi:hypothetical protein